jgi:hypothetical protein
MKNQAGFSGSILASFTFSILLVTKFKSVIINEIYTFIIIINKIIVLAPPY